MRTLRRPGVYALYGLGVAGVVTVLGHLHNQTASYVLFLGLGGLHVFYDGFIWKLRRPAVARSLDLAAVPAAAL